MTPMYRALRAQMGIFAASHWQPGDMSSLRREERGEGKRLSAVSMVTWTLNPTITIILVTWLLSRYVDHVPDAVALSFHGPGPGPRPWPPALALGSSPSGYLAHG
ncbi:hypothetical protein EYF80_036146 [Liparis tanakae]|uniref:Uncharacterized protein n=1 Tax=Liparis tanakae TaxID=230148 RepID=A0A4Z2GJA6_9TELE|nr:hypothetical protein EYF80_036146 [Liparis tanakae]